MDIKEKFGVKIKEIRKEKNILQEDLAKKINLHRSYLSAVEGGKNNITIENIEKIALGLGIDIKDLF